MNNLISDGKTINKSNRNKDPYWINLGLVDITTESALNFSHNFSNSTPTAAHVDLSPSSNPETTANGPILDINPLSAYPTKLPNTLKQFDGCRRVVSVCLTILRDWRFQMELENKF